MIGKNEKYIVDVTSINSSGFGVCRIDGIVCFVSGGVTGDKLEIKIIKSKKNYLVGRIEKIIKPSDLRCENDCDVFKNCGGCVYRHIGYENESEIKYNIVKDAFERIAHLDVKLNPIISADETLRYRNKAQFPVGEEKGRIYTGFFAPRSHNIIECDDCLLQPEEFSEITETLCKWAERYKINAYDGETGKGILRHIFLRKAESSGDVMLCVVANCRNIPHTDELIVDVREKFPFVKSIVLNINREKTNVILGAECVTLWGEDCIVDELCGIKVRISPLSFYQVNRIQAQKLYKKAAEYASLQENETLLDLYCGTGTIGLTMAKKVKKLIGVEIVPEAIEDAKINAELNGIDNAEFICADAERAEEIIREKGIGIDVMIVDPPRKGMSPETVKRIVSISPKKLVYVSCDPATLARDCALLNENGYQTVEATPVDLFPRTAHVESVVLLSKVYK